MTLNVGDFILLHHVYLFYGSRVSSPVREGYPTRRFPFEIWLIIILYLSMPFFLSFVQLAQCCHMIIYWGKANLDARRRKLNVIQSRCHAYTPFTSQTKPIVILGFKPYLSFVNPSSVKDELSLDRSRYYTSCPLEARHLLCHRVRKRNRKWANATYAEICFISVRRDKSFGQTFLALGVEVCYWTWILQSHDEVVNWWKWYIYKYTRIMKSKSSKRWRCMNMCLVREYGNLWKEVIQQIK
jgi:hypothetical protein